MKPLFEKEFTEGFRARIDTYEFVADMRENPDKYKNVPEAVLVEALRPLWGGPA